VILTTYTYYRVKVMVWFRVSYLLLVSYWSAYKVIAGMQSRPKSRILFNNSLNLDLFFTKPYRICPEHSEYTTWDHSVILLHFFKQSLMLFHCFFTIHCYNMDERELDIYLFFLIMT